MNKGCWIGVAFVAFVLASYGAKDSSAGGHPVGVVLHDTPIELPAVEFEDGDGNTLTLEDFRGRALLINIWATWCPPCREEMPTLDRLQGELGGEGFQVLAVSIDRGGVSVVRSFFDGVGIKHLGIYIDTSTQISQALRVIGLPTTILVDEEGFEVVRAIGPYEWDSPEIVDLLEDFIPVSSDE